MRTMTMDMSSYAVESDHPATVEYGDEVLDAGWNPQLALQQNVPGEHRDMPRCLVLEDVSAFLKRMYVSQR
ncbi:MAG: hypothetical protein HKM01_01580 [Gallionella sp.]|nr:hypothetical protein [Gallionella sp.]